MREPIYKVEKYTDIKDMLNKSGEKYGDRPAYLFRTDKPGKLREITHREFREQVTKLGTKLIDMGLKLDGIPGFYQDKDFKWTYKSHKGIFIPVTLDNKIQGLRIFLDNKYRIDTESIWFSSNNEYCGTKACNWLMLLKDENTSWLDLYNSETTNEIIVATEMILAHKIFNSTHKLVIGIPNNIDKDIILSIVNRMKIKNVLVYMDTYTIKHTSTFVYTNVIEHLQKNGINASLKIASVDNIEENIEKNVA